MPDSYLKPPPHTHTSPWSLLGDLGPISGLSELTRSAPLTSQGDCYEERKGRQLKAVLRLLKLQKSGVYKPALLLSCSTCSQEWYSPSFHLTFLPQVSACEGISHCNKETESSTRKLFRYSQASVSFGLFFVLSFFGHLVCVIFSLEIIFTYLKGHSVLKAGFNSSRITISEDSTVIITFF